MFCKNCGAELPEGAKFCTECGCDLASENTSQTSRNAGIRYGRPSSHLALSILVTLLCCVPFGIVAIIYASKVDSSWNAGKEAEAWEYSRKARNWSLWGIAALLLIWIVYVIILLAAGLSFMSPFEFTEEFFTSGPAVYDIASSSI